MLDHVITGSLYWIALGSFIWAYNDPSRFRDHFEHRYIVKRGRLPSRGLVVAAHIACMLKGPLLILIVLRNLHRRVWF